MRIGVCISGASGAPYAKRLIEFLNGKVELFVVASYEAKKIFKDETGVGISDFLRDKDVKYYDNDNFYSPLASGSFKMDTGIIVPCSVKSLSAIANGFSENLIYRFADVCMKENRKLVLVVRETPFSAIHLENMLKLARLGVTILPPIPAFYNKPRTIDDIVNFIVGRILDVIGVENSIYKRWV